MDAVNPDWLQLPAVRLLAALTEAPSLGAAARQVGMAQPNASRAIALLERRTGIRILDRSPRGSTLTEQGWLIAAWARDVSESLDRFAHGVQALTDNDSARIDVGASQTVAEYLAPDWLSQLKRERPHVTVMLHMHNSDEVVAGVTAGEFDLGFIESPHLPTHLHVGRIRADPLTVVVAPNHPWAAPSRLGAGVSLAELARTPLVVREVGSGTRALLDETLSSFDRVEPAAEFNSTSGIIRAVRQGLGPAVMSSLAAAEEIASGRLVAIDLVPMPLVRSLCAVWSGPSRLTGAAADLLAVALTRPDRASSLG